MSPSLRLAALAAVLATAGGVSVALAAAPAAPAIVVLEIENAARGTSLRLPLRAGETFSVVARHSMYDQPVTEEFTVGAAGRIELVAVSSPSAAVREYLGITAAGERHAMARALPELVFRVAAGVPQRLRAGGGERSFLELGDHGDRLVFRALRPPPPPSAPTAEARRRRR